MCHPKAASATAKLEDESEAKEVLQGLVDDLIEDSLEQQLTVGDFMQSPVLSAKPTMTEKQVEDLFIRYDVRALPVVDDENQVIGLVSYKEVSAAKMRLMNKQEKRLRQIEKAAAGAGLGLEEKPTIVPESNHLTDISINMFSERFWYRALGRDAMVVQIDDVQSQ